MRVEWEFETVNEKLLGLEPDVVQRSRAPVTEAAPPTSRWCQLSLSLSLSLPPSLSPSFLTSPPPSLSLSLFHLLKAQPKRFSQGISPLYIEHCYRFGTTLRSVSALATGCIHLLGPDSDGWHL